MQLIIKFAYDGTVSITDDNIQELLLAADQFDVKGVVGACCDYMGERLRPENCIGAWQISDICFCPQLKNKAFQFILNNFKQVVSSEQFQQLSAPELCDILDRDQLIVPKERTVFEAIHQWITHEPERRKAHFVVLLSKVHYCSL